MGAERKEELQSPTEIERTVQETTVLLNQSAQLVLELGELLKRAKQLVAEQKALGRSFKGEK